ncbi:hypothetical protein B296_00020906 [Ensete ventricosum]|uniref:Uncharacterized protein n=1 Tax=Ensete ventricosum TaxID=4639 RepID=A0A426Z9D3_ENSVE|nr:hypothetical protein B296_00020906 [Ensete ventricosum]
MIRSIELQPYNEPRSSLSIRLGFKRCSGILPEFARRFTEWIGKLARNMLGDYQKKTIGLAVRLPDWRDCNMPLGSQSLSVAVVE